MSTALTLLRLLQGSNGTKTKRRTTAEFDQFGRTGQTQVLSVDLYYSDGTTGVINVTSPHIIWGEDIENQWFGIRTYINSQRVRLGIIRYQAHCYFIESDGNVYKHHSWGLFDFITNQYTI